MPDAPPLKTPLHRRKALWVSLAVLVVLGGVAFVFRDFLFMRFGTVKDQTLYRSALLDEDELRSVIDEHGIKTVVNLTKDPNADTGVGDYKGVDLVWLPSTQVPPDEVVQGFLDIMDDPARHPVLIHCKHGVGRTGVLTAIYRMEYERWTVEQALAEARRYALWGSFSEGSSKERYLRSYNLRAP